MVRKVREPLDEARRRALDETRAAIASQLGGISEVRLEHASTPGQATELRIEAGTYSDWPYVDMRIWVLKEDDQWVPTRSGVTMSPNYVLSGVVEALRQVLSGKEFWARKARRPGVRRPDVIRVRLEIVEPDLFVVDVRTLVLEPGGYVPTEKGLTVPLHLLDQVIAALDRFAQAVGQVEPKYLRPQLITMPDEYSRTRLGGRLASLDRAANSED